MKNATFFSSVNGKYKIFSMANILLGCLSFLGLFAIFGGTAANKTEIMISLLMFLVGFVILIIRNKKHINFALSILICFIQIIFGMVAVFFVIACAVFGISNNKTENTQTQTVYTPSKNINAAKKSWKNDMNNDELAKKYGYDNVKSAINDSIDIHGNKI